MASLLVAWLAAGYRWQDAPASAFGEAWHKGQTHCLSPILRTPTVCESLVSGICSSLGSVSMIASTSLQASPPRQWVQRHPSSMTLASGVPRGQGVSHRSVSGLHCQAVLRQPVPTGSPSSAPPASQLTSLKEWAPACAALGNGEQTVSHRGP